LSFIRPGQANVIAQTFTGKKRVGRVGVRASVKQFRDMRIIAGAQGDRAAYDLNKSQGKRDTKVFVETLDTQQAESCGEGGNGPNGTTEWGA